MTNGDTATFIDFDISVLKPAPGAYIVTSQTDESGRATDMLDWATLSDADFVDKLERIREYPHEAQEPFLREIGGVLFNAMFRGQIRDHFVAVFTQQVLTDPNTYMRLRLDIHEAASEIAVIPWEFMIYDGVFLGTQNRTLLTRNFLNWQVGPIPPFQIEEKPRVLVVIPRGSGLNTDSEKVVISEALEAAGIPFYVLEDRVSVARMVDELARKEYHILHFIGHGEFREDDNGELHGTLRFNASYEEEDEDEDIEKIQDSTLQGILGNHPSVKLALLNACKGAQLAEKSTGYGFVGTAIGLLKGRVPAVIAMQYSIYDNVAKQFAETFYSRLTTPGPWAGHVDIAVAQARSACQYTFPNDRGFGTPILYLRAKNGKIFDLSPDDKPKPNGNNNHPLSDCEKPPEPDRRLLDKHTLSDADVMAGEVESIRKRIKTKQRNIKSWKDLEDSDKLIYISGDFAVKIERAQEKIEELARELDEAIEVAQWKAYELCLETEKIEQKLRALEKKRDDLIARGERVPYKLKGEIGRTHDQLIKLQVRLENVREKLAV